MVEIAKICVEYDLLVLSDEAYFSLVFSGTPRSIVSQPGMLDRTVILHTYSKAYSMTGWRLGAAVGPEWIISGITKLNVNDEGCTTLFIQWAGLAAFTQEAEEASKKIVEELRTRRDLLIEEFKTIPGFSTITTNSTFYLFVNITKAAEKLGMDYEQFRKTILQKTGVSFCTREHFGKSLPEETQKYVRFAYSGIGVDMIKEACQKMRDFLTGVFSGHEEKKIKFIAFY